MSEILHNEPELLKRVADGDESAMGYVFDLYYSRLHYFALKLLVNDEDAQDIAQEAVLSFWQRRESFSESSLKEVEAFMFTVARNRCYNYIRDQNTRNKKKAILADTISSSENLLELAIIKEDIFNRVYQEIQQLPPVQAKLLKMIFVDNLETAEIAEKLQITQNNVRNQKARALEKLRTALLRKRLLINILLFFY